MMDIEQLKLVVEAISQLGIQGKEAFIWWLLFDKMLPVICWLTTLVFVGVCIFKLVRLLHGNEGKLMDIRDMLEVGSPGFFTEEEFGSVVREIRRLQEIAKKAISL